jgi:hypothetical protein
MSMDQLAHNAIAYAERTAPRETEKHRRALADAFIAGALEGALALVDEVTHAQDNASRG